jgi:hypothetical protein
VFGGVAGGVIPADPAASAATQNAKIPGNMALDSAGFPGISSIMPPQGPEEIANSRGKPTLPQDGGVAGGVICPELMELIALWRNIPPETRTAFLAIARSALK